MRRTVSADNFVCPVGMMESIPPTTGGAIRFEPVSQLKRCLQIWRLLLRGEEQPNLVGTPENQRRFHIAYSAGNNCSCNDREHMGGCLTGGRPPSGLRGAKPLRLGLEEGGRA